MTMFCRPAQWHRVKASLSDWSTQYVQLHVWGCKYRVVPDFCPGPKLPGCKLSNFWFIDFRPCVSWLVQWTLSRSVEELGNSSVCFDFHRLYVPVSPWHYSSGWVVWGDLIVRAPTAFPDRWKQRGWSGAKAWCAAISLCWTIQCSLVTSMWVACVYKLTRVREREREKQKVKSLDWLWFSHVAQLLDLSW